MFNCNLCVSFVVALNSFQIPSPDLTSLCFCCSRYVRSICFEWPAADCFSLNLPASIRKAFWWKKRIFFSVMWGFVYWTQSLQGRHVGLFIFIVVTRFSLRRTWVPLAQRSWVLQGNQSGVLFEPSFHEPRARTKQKREWYLQRHDPNRTCIVRDRQHLSELEFIASFVGTCPKLTPFSSWNLLNTTHQSRVSPKFFVIPYPRQFLWRIDSFIHSFIDSLIH